VIGVYEAGGPSRRMVSSASAKALALASLFLAEVGAFSHHPLKTNPIHQRDGSTLKTFIKATGRQDPTKYNEEEDTPDFIEIVSPKFAPDTMEYIPESMDYIPNSMDLAPDSMDIDDSLLNSNRELDDILLEKALRFYDPNFVGEREKAFLVGVEVKGKKFQSTIA
ncbi:unnamed protein product, partial [Heterosigma akashiwo]